MAYDLVIRGGTIVDGTGGAPFVGDVAIEGGRIAAVGTVEGSATREIDAKGKLVTPGFVDIHTHYDGQAIWSDRMSPSSSHGVTTVVMGNCGVGFAPCRPQDHDALIDVMEGVEDIPGAVMAAGLPWDWETFPEYLDALDSRKRDIDVAAFLPHSPLRVYVMGKRGVEREPSTSEDRAKMRALAKEAMEAGALGFASSRLMMHKTGKGEAIPTYGIAEEEIAAIADGLNDAGGGLLQFVPDVPREGYAKILGPIFDIAEEKKLPITFTMGVGNSGPQIWPQAVELVEKSNAAGGHVTAQIYPRPIGLVIGLELTANPFVLCPSYQKIAHLPLAERVAEMKKPEVKAKIISEEPGQGHPLTEKARNWEWIFPFGKDADYEPGRENSILARAKARGVSPEDEAYDRLLDDNGHAMMMLAMGNFHNNSLDLVGELMHRKDMVLGLGDGGAHYGMVCDASYPTFMLQHWTRDREGTRIGIAEAVQALAAKPAKVAGLLDRGLVKPGYKADLNVIDHAAVKLHVPTIIEDLPGGGRRLNQTADGFIATIVAGQVIAENGQPTDALPGRLVRGRQAEPA
ncbi:N-acyl-D-amino-acid deacylase family protein [Sphingomonas crocodyli]|uniref:D-aminoacylase n=1 Tax=Sphingomonas crocodyli TaxID=1979270 RepID=A0A437MB24_9SPHN|nr:amidohydrolase family protein [Sphingomonas crocodyli]RVT94828.1 D-aminoacylase [Sphingomonas crocodyli]